jgi:single-strand DNA-binding protein
MIKLQIIGNLGKDCIVKEVNGKNVINFSVAHTERYKDSQGNQKERTTWVECAYWTDRTAVAQYLTKGRTVYAEGSPEADAYSNKEGQPAATLRMRVQNVQLLSNNGNEGTNAGNSNTGYSNANSTTVSTGSVSAPAEMTTTVGDDGLPF